MNVRFEETVRPTQAAVLGDPGDIVRHGGRVYIRGNRTVDQERRQQVPLIRVADGYTVEVSNSDTVEMLDAELVIKAADTQED